MQKKKYFLLCLLAVFLGIAATCKANIASSNSQVKTSSHNKKLYRIYSQKNPRVGGLSISSLGREYEFILFYEPECGHCIAFAPILKRYAAAAGIQVLAFVFAGANKATSLFASSTVVDQSTVAQFFGQGTKISTPTLFIWNKRNGHVYPVASGMHTYEELDSRMNDLAPKILRKEAEFGEENKYV
jgi:thiol-disulfide isomerase/thioredoxin